MMASNRPASLRKACQNCSKRKRKCIIELPKCVRCRHRGLDCRYDLEPLTSTHGGLQKCRRGDLKTPSRSSLDGTDRLFLDFISSLHMSHKIQAFCQHATLGLSNRCLAFSPVAVSCDSDDTDYLVDQLMRVPKDLGDGVGWLFTHSALHENGLHPWMQRAIGEGGTHTSGLSDILTVDANSAPVVEFLAAYQALTMTSIRALFTNDCPKTTILLVNTLSEWCAILCETAVSRMPPNLSPWHSWLLSESIRRTILMSFLIAGVYDRWRFGWCSHQLFIDALPFSTQSELWHAKTEEEWTIAADMGKAGALRYFHEFTSSFAQNPFQLGGDEFQRLLLIAHHGKDEVEKHLLRADKASTARQGSVMFDTTET